jgi:hypothetical protein
MIMEEARVREEHAALAYTQACIAVLEAECALQRRLEERRIAAERHTFSIVARIKAEQTEAHHA